MRKVRFRSLFPIISTQAHKQPGFTYGANHHYVQERNERFGLSPGYVINNADGSKILAKPKEFAASIFIVQFGS